MGERLFISGECIGETLEIFYFRHNTTGGPTFWRPFVFCTHQVLKLEMMLVVVADMEVDKLADMVMKIPNGDFTDVSLAWWHLWR